MSLSCVTIFHTVPPCAISISLGTAMMLPSTSLHSLIVYLVNPANSMAAIIASRTDEPAGILVGMPSSSPFLRPVSLEAKSSPANDSSWVVALYLQLGALIRYIP